MDWRKLLGMKKGVKLNPDEKRELLELEKKAYLEEAQKRIEERGKRLAREQIE